MADDFQSQPMCPYCHDTGIEIHYKGIPELEEEARCECGIMSANEYYAMIDERMKNWGKSAEKYLLGLKNEGIDVVKHIKGLGDV